MEAGRNGNSAKRIPRLLVVLAVGLASFGCASGTGGNRPPPTDPDAPSPRRGPGDARVLEGWASMVPEAEIDFTVIADSLPGDPSLEALVAPFRAQMGEEIRQVIGEAVVPLSEAVPEGTLGNFAADAMLWAARRAISEPIQMAMTNNGGLRVPIAPGPITVGLLFELMPFENMLSVLVLSGRQIQTFADELAVRRGQPIAGFSFRIETEGETRVARDLLVDGLPLEPSGEYRLVTNDYLANGGDGFESLQNPISREDLPILVRDAFIEYVREIRVIQARIEGRITGGIGR